MLEQSHVDFGRTRIGYAIERGARKKTVAVAVEPTGAVRVRAPQGTPVARLDAIVERKARWIVERRQRLEDLPPPLSPREFVNGETFRYLGKQYRLRVVEGAGTVRLLGGHLVVSSQSQGDEGEIRRALVAWYRERAAERLAARVPVWAERLGVHAGRVLVRDQRARWGSADAAGNLRFNWRIVQAPTRLLDYIVAHELVHLVYPDHTRDFWATLGRAMPDYEARREALRRLGRHVVW